jgi:hypothetical protein
MATSTQTHDSFHGRWFSDAEIARQWNDDLQAATRVPALLVSIIFVGMILMAFGVLLAISHA